MKRRKLPELFDERRHRRVFLGRAHKNARGEVPECFAQQTLDFALAFRSCNVEALQDPVVLPPHLLVAARLFLVRPLYYDSIMLLYPIILL